MTQFVGRHAAAFRLIVGALLGGLFLWGGVASADLGGVIPRIKPSIVAVGTYLPTRNPAFRFLGTGFAVGNGSLIATNAHVLPATLQTEQMEVLAVALPGGGAVAIRKASRGAADRNSDLALLRVEGTPLPPLRLADGELAEEGRSIAFTGFPIGSALGLAPVTHRGIIAAVTPIGIPQATSQQLSPALVRRLSEGAFRVYQLDATAYPGNSGSPMYDAESGEILGVVNMVFVKNTKEAVLSDPSGITYAIPVSYLTSLLKNAE